MEKMSETVTITKADYDVLVIKAMENEALKSDVTELTLQRTQV